MEKYLIAAIIGGLLTFMVFTIIPLKLFKLTPYYPSSDILTVNAMTAELNSFCASTAPELNETIVWNGIIRSGYPNQEKFVSVGCTVNGVSSRYWFFDYRQNQ